MRLSLLSAALVSSLVGYGGTVALLLAAAVAVGATPAQTASWLFAICIVKGLGSLLLSWRFRVPAILAWSTAGAALIAATEGVSMGEAAAAFLVASLLAAASGAFAPLARAVAAIPEGIAAGMLAGVLLPFCLKAAPAAAAAPALVLPMVAVFLAVRLRNPAVGVLAAFACGLAVAFGSGAAVWPAMPDALPVPELVWPEFDAGVILGLGLPLWLVTMASQNLPGFATLRAAGFDAPVRPALGVTGGLSALGALFGAHPVGMAAITAAICMGDDVHPDRAQRWKVAIPYAAIWTGLALAGPAIVAILAALPGDLMAALVALALLAPLTGALAGAFARPEQRFAAVTTLAVTASGVAVWGVGAAFWGLAAGLGVMALERLRAKS